MKQCTMKLFIKTMLLVVTVTGFAYGQGGGSTSSLSGVVVDQSGGTVPGAEVRVKNNATSSEAKAASAENGTFSIPALSAGTYTATVTIAGFKQSVLREIKIEAGVPATIRVTLEIGGLTEMVTVEAGAEMVQSQTANITTTMASSQIGNLPLVSRNAMDFIPLLPGVNTTGNSNRDSTIAGLAQHMINITIDGVSSMDNYNRSTDGFFSRVSPRLDAVEEVTISTATPGAESGGQGAVQIRFITRSGTNEYHGSLYEYLRNPVLNANNWFNNRDLPPDPRTGKAPRDREILNQFGARVGGPIRFPKKLFGPFGFDGRDRAFFFINMEESRSPNQVTRNQTIFTPEAELGNFLYSDSAAGVTRSVNLFQLAASKGMTSTWDPTIQKLLADIRASTAKGGLNAQQNPLYQTLTFANKGMGRTRFITSRFDVNLTSKHRLELVWNHHKYFSLPYDNTNNGSPAYPDFPNYRVQGSNRFTGSLAFRSTLTSRLVNEARVGLSGGSTLFSPNISPSMFSGPLADEGGFALNINNSLSVANPYRNYTPSRRNAPTRLIEDTVTWTKGSHSLSFGATWTEVGLWVLNQTTVPEIRFGVDTTYDPAKVLFDSTNGTKNFQGASSSQITAARNMYAVLTGRVAQVIGTAYLDELTNKYSYNGDRIQRGHMRELGSFVSDSWRVRPGLTLNLGLRWEMQFPFVPGNDVYTTATPADVWGVSGIGNLFKPGTLTGKEPQFTQYKAGTGAYNLSHKDFAPSLGIAWSPNAKDGWLKRFAGGTGQTVIRAGYSIAYSRMGMATYAAQFSSNPGSFVTATRNVNNGNLVSGAGSDTWPILFRERSRLGPPTFQTDPVYPMKGSISDSVTIFEPNLRTPYAQSYTLGVQREIMKGMVIEVRYVGTRSAQTWTTYNLNEHNVVENGFLDEFKLAMANLQANIAAGRGNTFKYAGPNTGTSPLPITLAYFGGYTKAEASDPSKYTSSNFTSSTYVNTLAPTNPNSCCSTSSSSPSFEYSLWNDPTRRANAAKAGLPANFFIVNPSLQGGANITGNGGFTWYDSMVVELRRRMAKGLLIQANYVWGKSFGTTRLTLRRDRVKDLGDTAPHAFKINWVYELPIGRGRAMFSGMHPVLDRIVGGWDFHGVSRIQSGDLQDFGNVRLVGMTPQDLKDAYELRFDDTNKHVYVLPDDIIKNTIAAFNVSATEPSGYSKTYGTPTGRYIAPANSGSCIQVVAGDCAPRHYYVRGAPFVNFDLSLVKRIRFTEQRNFEIRAEFLNAFNNINFDYITAPDGFAVQNFGEVTAAQSTGRRIQLGLRINF